MVKGLKFNAKHAYEILKLLLSCIGIFMIIYFTRYFIPSYNGESYYFPIQVSGSEIENNQKRIKMAKEILDNFDWKILKEKPRLNLSISIIAADRKLGYVTQSIAFILEQVKKWEKVPTISICNVEKHIFDELKIFADKLQIYSINEKNTNVYFQLNDDSGRIKKEAADYWSCLNTVNSNAKTDFVLLVEDDAVPVPYFGLLIDSLMSQLSSDQLDFIDYVKLFHPWRLRKIPFISQAISVSVTLGIIISYFVFRRFSITVIAILCIFSYACLKQDNYYEIFADARFHFTSSAYITPSESCCTPGVLFRSTSIPSMLKHFVKQPVEDAHAKDHILDESPFVGKATDFNYFVHIGHFSSVRQKIIPLDSLPK